MSTPLFILGAADPEMAAIESLLHAAGVPVAYALDGSGEHVTPATAYQAARLSRDSIDGYDCIVLVECDLPGWFCGDPAPRVIRIDHHWPDDPGYGRPPAEFLPASSIGQVVSLLAARGMWSGVCHGPTDEPAGTMRYCGGRWLVSVAAPPDSGGSPIWASIPDEIVLVAAADHCLTAAYRGECPGVSPDALMEWRAKSRAAHQRRPVADLLADVGRAREILRGAVAGGAEYADLRDRPSIPELPEAAAREGVPFIAEMRERDGRLKVVLQAAPPDLVRRFLIGEIVPGLVDMYGDPARGFAGGYTP